MPCPFSCIHSCAWPAQVIRPSGEVGKEITIGVFVRDIFLDQVCALSVGSGLSVASFGTTQPAPPCVSVGSGIETSAHCQETRPGRSEPPCCCSSATCRTCTGCRPDDHVNTVRLCPAASPRRRPDPWPPRFMSPSPLPVSGSEHSFMRATAGVEIYHSHHSIHRHCLMWQAGM